MMSRLARAITQMCIMSSMRHESDIALLEDSLTRATTGLVQLCKPAVRHTLGMSDEKVYDFCVSIRKRSVSNGWQTRCFRSLIC